MFLVLVLEPVSEKATRQGTIKKLEILKWRLPIRGFRVYDVFRAPGRELMKN